MESISDRFPQFTLYLVITIALIAALFLGEAIGSGELVTLAEIVGAIGALTWLVAARRYWWLTFAFGVGIGGFFTVPYRIYPHELALGVALIALIPQLFFHQARRKLPRPKLPIAFYVLGAYVIASFLFCLLQNKGNGFGNIARGYMNAAWPFIFGFFFWRYGSTAVLRAALRVIYVAALIRMGFGLINYFAGHVYTIPGINYSIDPQDLRASGSITIVLAALFALMRGRIVYRIFHWVIVLISALAILLGGSRTGMAQLLFFPLFFFAINRRWLLMMGAAGCSLVLILSLNANPRVLYKLPYRVARAASILLVHEKTDVQEDVKASNEWHRVALPSEAYKRWTESSRSMAFGTGIRPYNPLELNIFYGRDFIYAMAQVSADMGAYESGFWTVLAVTGLVGLGLYLWLLGWLLMQLLPVLFKRGMRDVVWAALFWACYSIVSWIVFAVPSGTYPSFEIFIGLLALAAIRDAGILPAVRHRKAPPPPMLQQPPLRTRHLVPVRRELGSR